MQQQKESGKPLMHLMQIRAFSKICSRLIVLLACCTNLAANEEVENPIEQPWSVDHWTVQTSVYTRHWNPHPDHNNNQQLLGLESHFNNHWLTGAAVFQNSFGQSSQMVYLGKKWDLSDSQHLYFKFVGGFLHGYKAPYEDKIPFNGLGAAPVLIPSVGFRYRHLIIESTFAGNAAVTITAGLSF